MIEGVKARKMAKDGPAEKRLLVAVSNTGAGLLNILDGCLLYRRPSLLLLLEQIHGSSRHDAVICVACQEHSASQEGHITTMTVNIARPHLVLLKGGSKSLIQS